MKPHRSPWDGRESVIDAVERHGLREVFADAINRADQEAAARVLTAVGVDDETAEQIIGRALEGLDRQG
jgi:hypothetical protein